MTTRAPHALIVDDDPQLLRLLGHYLRAAGFEVREAEDGEAALQAIGAQCPDFLITDWDMPRMDGVELCRRVRQEDLPHYVYVLFLTCKRTSAELIEALDAGADDVVVYPEDGSIEVISSFADFLTVKEALEKAGFKAELAEVTMRPQTEVSLTGEDAAKMQKLLDALEDLDDVQDVYTSASIEE